MREPLTVERWRITDLVMSMGLDPNHVTRVVIEPKTITVEGTWLGFVVDEIVDKENDEPL